MKSNVVSPDAWNSQRKSSSFDGSDGGGYDDDMLKRVEKLETEIAAIKLDVAVIKANGATKSDISDTKAAISEAKTSIILWVVTAIFITQLLPALLKKFGM